MTSPSVPLFIYSSALYASYITDKPYINHYDNLHVCSLLSKQIFTQSFVVSKRSKEQSWMRQTADEADLQLVPHTHSHTYIHTCIHTYTHTHTHSQTLLFSFASLGMCFAITLPSPSIFLTNNYSPSPFFSYLILLHLSDVRVCVCTVYHRMSTQPKRAGAEKNSKQLIMVLRRLLTRRGLN